MKIKILMILLIILFMVGCEQKDIETNQTETTTQAKELTVIESDGMTNVYSLSVDKVTFPGYYSLHLVGDYMDSDYYKLYNAGYDRMFISDDKVYVAMKRRKPYTDKEGLESIHDSLIMIHAFNEDSNEVEYYELMPNNYEAAVILMYFDSEFNYVTIEELNGEYTLNKLTKDAEETIFSIPIDDIASTGIFHSLVIGENENIYIATESKIFVYTKDGERICEISPEYKIEYISSAHNKKPIVKLIDYNNSASYAYIDAETKSFTSLELQVDKQYYMFSNIIYGEGYDYYHVTNNGIYGYDIASNTLTKILDWRNSDIEYLNVKCLAIFSPDKILAIQYDKSQFNYYVNVLNHVPDDEIPEKTYITLGYIGYGTDTYIDLIVSQFNKQSSKYRIVMKNYFTDSATDPKIRLNNEIAAGNIPDLLYINSSVPYFNYAKKGFFVDLYDYLETDSELYDDLLPLALEPTEIDDRLYQLITRAYVRTNIGKVSNIGDINSMTISEMYDLYKSLPDNIMMSSEMTRYNFNTIVINNLLSECLDYDNGTCNFTTQTFEDYIALMKLLPEYPSYYINQYDDYMDYRDTMIMKFKNDEMLLYNVFITEIYTFLEAKYKYAGDEEITYIGYPTPDGDVRGDYVESSGFAMFTTSENKDGAWEFIKYCYSNKVMGYGVNGFVPTYSGLDIANRFYNGFYFYFGDDGRSFYDPMGSNTKEDIIEESGSGIVVLFEEEEANFFEFIESVTNFSYTDIDVVNIINEELESYYNSNKSAAEVAKTIQSRVSIYMSEIWS